MARCLTGTAMNGKMPDRKGHESKMPGRKGHDPEIMRSGGPQKRQQKIRGSFPFLQREIVGQNREKNICERFPLSGGELKNGPDGQEGPQKIRESFPFEIGKEDVSEILREFSPF